MDLTCLSLVCTHQPQGTCLGHRGCQVLQGACTKRQIIPFSCQYTVVVLRVPLVLSGLRFRSITKQYFRKADGILVMYDVTAECSFTAVRNWMSSVQVRAGPWLSNTGSAAVAFLQTSSNSLFGSNVVRCPGGPIDLGKMNYQSRCSGYCLW